MAKSMIAATAISPKVFFSGASVRGAILAELRNNQVPAFKKAFEVTTSTWRHQPFFHAEYFFTGGDVRVYIFTFDKPWNWLEEGTRIRYASMHKGFARKTNPKQLAPGAGAGNPDPMYVTKKKPHAGIEPRGWRAIIMKSERSPFLRGINNAVGKAMLKTKKTP